MWFPACHTIYEHLGISKFIIGWSINLAIWVHFGNATVGYKNLICVTVQVEMANVEYEESTFRIKNAHCR